MPNTKFKIMFYMFTSSKLKQVYIQQILTFSNFKLDCFKKAYEGKSRFEIHKLIFND